MSEAVTRLRRLAAGRCPAGVHTAASSGVLPGTLAAVARERGLAAWVLDTADAPSKAAFLDRCAQALALPTWFGRNWDALVDALRDVAPVGAAGGVVLWVHAAAVDADVRSVALEVFEERAAVAPPFSVLVLDTP